MEFRTVDSHPGCIVHKVTFGAGIGDYLTQDWLVPVAIETVPAARVPRANHMVARGNEGDPIAHRFDDTGPLMAEHDWQRIGKGPLDYFQVCMA